LNADQKVNGANRLLQHRLMKSTDILCYACGKYVSNGVL
jgi:hypothetical protein